MPPATLLATSSKKVQHDGDLQKTERCSGKMLGNGPKPPLRLWRSPPVSKHPFNTGNEDSAAGGMGCG